MNRSSPSANSAHPLHPPGEVIGWYFMRLSGILLLVMVLFHLYYMHFLIPGGIDSISYQTIIARWTHPVLGFGWRVFDLLLLWLSLSHGANGIRQMLGRTWLQSGWQRAGGVLLGVVYLALLSIGTSIIFSI